MLVSTDARNNASSSQLKGNLELSTTLSDAAKAHNADALDANDELQRVIKVAETTYTQQGGTGQQATVPGYEEPLLAFSSPAGIVSATPKSHDIAAGEHLHLSSQQDMNIAVGNKLSMAVKEAWSVFVARAGIKLFAGKGKVQIQAQDDEIEAIAKKDIRITSTSGDVEITALKGIRLTAGGAQVEIGNGKITLKAPGPVNIHGSVKNFTGPASVNPVLPHLPQGEIRPSDFEFRYTYHDGEPVKAATYKAIFADGTTKTGVLDAEGHVKIENAPSATATIIVEKDPRPFEKFKYQAKPDDELDDWLNQ